MRSLVVGDQRTAVPELVLLPGLGACGYLLRAARAAAAWTRVHVLDLPGFGHGATARLPADLGAVSAATTAWLQSVPRRPVLLLGHSTGAQAALRAALETPASVTGLVLAGVTFPPAARPRWALATRTARTLLHERPGEVPAVLPYYLRGARGLPVLLGSGLRDRPEDVVGALQPPLLVLRGRHDRLCPAPWARELAAAAPRGLVQELPGAHNFPWTRPDETSDVLRRFAEQVSRSARPAPAPHRPGRAAPGSTALPGP